MVFFLCPVTNRGNGNPCKRIRFLLILFSDLNFLIHFSKNSRVYKSSCFQEDWERNKDNNHKCGCCNCTTTGSSCRCWNSQFSAHGEGLDSAGVVSHCMNIDHCPGHSLCRKHFWLDFLLGGGICLIFWLSMQHLFVCAKCSSVGLWLLAWFYLPR